MSRSPRSPQLDALVARFADQLTRLVEAAIEARADVLARDMLQSLSTPRRRGRPPNLLRGLFPAARPARGDAEGASPAPPGPADGGPGDHSPAQPSPSGRTARPGQPDMNGRASEPRPAGRSSTPASGRRPGERSAIRRGRQPPPPPVVDPAHEQRDAELARLRAILKPTHEDPPPARLPVPEVPTPWRAEVPPDALKELEGDIRAGVDALPGLPHERRAARIATWVGRARLEEQTGTPGRKNVAAMMLLEKLRGLAREMDVGMIEALTPSWAPPSWQRYIRMNESAAQAPEAPPVAAPAPPPAPVPASAAGATPANDTSVAAEPPEEYGQVWGTVPRDPNR